MDIGKTRILVPELGYWVSMNTDIKYAVKQHTTCTEYQQMEQQERVVPYEIQCRPRKVITADIFMIDNIMLLCIVHYYSKFPIVKRMASFAVDNLVQTAKLYLLSMDSLKRIVSDAGTNFTSETSRHFSRHLYIQQSVTSS